MKRIMYAIIPTMLLTAACNSGLKDVYPDLVPISFGMDVASETVLTRAGDSCKLEDVAFSFVVTGYKNVGTDVLEDVMTNYTVRYVAGGVANASGWDYSGKDITPTKAASSVTNTSGWEYVGQGTDQVVKYWDFSATEYRFAAYVPKQTGGVIDYSASMVKDADNIKLTLGNMPRIAVDESEIMTLPDGTEVSESDLPMMSRLWKGNPLQEGAVCMEFIKPYAKLCIELHRTADFAAQNITGMQLSKVSGVIPDSGTLVVNYPLKGSGGITSAFTPSTNGTSTLLYADVSASKLADPDVPCPLYPQYMLCPDPENTSDYLFTLVCDEETKRCTIPADKMKLEPGYSYRFIFKLTPSSPLTKAAVASTHMNSTLNAQDFTLELSSIIAF